MLLKPFLIKWVLSLSIPLLMESRLSGRMTTQSMKNWRIKRKLSTKSTTFTSSNRITHTTTLSRANKILTSSGSTKMFLGPLSFFRKTRLWTSQAYRMVALTKWIKFQITSITPTFILQETRSCMTFTKESKGLRDTLGTALLPFPACFRLPKERPQTGPQLPWVTHPTSQSGVETPGQSAWTPSTAITTKTPFLHSKGLLTQASWKAWRLKAWTRLSIARGCRTLRVKIYWANKKWWKSMRSLINWWAIIERLKISKTASWKVCSRKASMIKSLAMSILEGRSTPGERSAWWQASKERRTWLNLTEILQFPQSSTQFTSRNSRNKK